MSNLVESAVALVWPDLPFLRLSPIDRREELRSLAREAAEMLCLEAEGRITHLYAEITRHQILDRIEVIAAKLEPQDRDFRRVVDDIRIALIARDGPCLRRLASHLAGASVPH